MLFHLPDIESTFLHSQIGLLSPLNSCGTLNTNIRPWLYKKSREHVDTKEPGLIKGGGLVLKGGLVRQIIRYPAILAFIRLPYLNASLRHSILNHKRPKPRSVAEPLRENSAIAPEMPYPTL
jgi:hypothetical protein